MAKITKLKTQQVILILVSQESPSYNFTKLASNLH